VSARQLRLEPGLPPDGLKTFPHTRAGGSVAAYRQVRRAALRRRGGNSAAFSGCGHAKSTVMLEVPLSQRGVDRSKNLTDRSPIRPS
jgi:hypothetical protein